MGLINKLFEPVKSFVQKRKNEICLAGCIAIAPFIAGGCGDSSSSDKKDKPVNYAPVMEEQADASILENQNFTRDINATDANDDVLTYSLAEAPTGATIDSVTGEIAWTPNDSQSNQWSDFTAVVFDGEKYAEKSFKVYAVNTTTAEGYVQAFADDSSLENIKISMDNLVNGTFTAWTDSNGKWQIINLPDGDYDTMIKDGNAVPVYDTYVPGIFQSMKSKEVDGKIKRNCKLSKMEIRDFLNDVERYNGDLRRWNVKPKFRIYTIENHYGNPVDPAKINEVRGIIKTELSDFFQDTSSFADADIEEVDTTGGGYEDGYFVISFNDYMGGYGANSSQFDEDKNITSSDIIYKTSCSKHVLMQELTEGAIGGGETNDPIYLDSVTYDDGTGTGAETYSQEDWETSKRHYKQEFQRKLRNIDFGGGEWRDYDPGWDHNEVYWNE